MKPQTQMTSSGWSSYSKNGLIEWVFLLFLAGKLGFGDTGIHDWSWWWVTSPLWIGFLLIFIIATVKVFAKSV